MAEIAVPRVVSSSRVGVDPFRYWWLGTFGVVVTVGWLVIMIGGFWEGNVVVGMMRKAGVSLGMVGMACGGGLRRCLRET